MNAVRTWLWVGSILFVGCGSPGISQTTVPARPTPQFPKPWEPLGCKVEIGKLLDAQEYSGPGPLTPSMADAWKRDPNNAQTWSGISHGDKHIQCTYRVSVNGAAYDYMHVIGNTFQRFELSRCNENEVRDAVEKEIRTATEECTDLHRGEYYGHTLVPAK